jgi:hypothetical protein
MAENKDNNFGELEKLALIAESCQTIFSGKATVVFELPKGEYTSVINHFREVDRQHKQFTIDISDTEFVFILNEEKS